jgi:hypothetical protein
LTEDSGISAEFWGPAGIPHFRFSGCVSIARRNAHRRARAHQRRLDPAADVPQPAIVQQRSRTQSGDGAICAVPRSVLGDLSTQTKN